MTGLRMCFVCGAPTSNNLYMYKDRAALVAALDAYVDWHYFTSVNVQYDPKFVPPSYYDWSGSGWWTGPLVAFANDPEQKVAAPQSVCDRWLNDVVDTNFSGYAVVSHRVCLDLFKSVRKHSPKIHEVFGLQHDDIVKYYGQGDQLTFYSLLAQYDENDYILQFPVEGSRNRARIINILKLSK